LLRSPTLPIPQPVIYRETKYCITGPHFPATIFISIFISAATYFFGFIATDAKSGYTGKTNRGVREGKGRGSWKGGCE